MTKRAFLALLSGIPLVGRLFANEKTVRIEPPMDWLPIPAPSKPAKGPLDTYFECEAERIQKDIMRNAPAPKGEPRIFAAYCVTSELICLEDARDSWQFASLVRARVKNFTIVARDTIAQMPSNLALHNVRVKVEWQNKVNIDHTSEDYNPLGNRGRFVALITHREDAA